jgi:hypothetical protein
MGEITPILPCHAGGHLQYRHQPMPFGALSDHQKMEKGICMCNKIRYFVES